jgi:hypothetical protein
MWPERASERRGLRAMRGLSCVSPPHRPELPAKGVYMVDLLVQNHGSIFLLIL